MFSASTSPLFASCIAFLILLGTLNTPNNGITKPLVKPRLQLTSTILDERSCSPDHFAMRLRFHIHNIGDQPVILHKNRIISRIMVSSDLQAANKKNYKLLTRADDPGDQEGLNKPDFKNFVTIESGSVTEFEEYVTVYLYNAMRPSEQFLSEGTFVLQVAIGTWPYIADSQPFRKKWKDQGYLWDRVIVSEPMSFTIAKNRPLTKCM